VVNINKAIQFLTL